MTLLQEKVAQKPEALAPVRLSDGTTIQLYKDAEALRAAYRAIEAAKFRICLEVYIFADDDTGRAFADLLARKAREGLRVYVIYDSFGSLGSDRNLFKMMRKAGVKLLEFHPLAPWKINFGWKPINRDHRKLLIIDSDIVGMGGLNIGENYSGSWSMGRHSKCNPWRDNAIAINGPAARYYLQSFARTWRYIIRGGRLRTAEYIHNEHDLGVLASVPTLNSPLRPLLCNLFRGAREHIQMTIAYFAPDDLVVNELIAAARRGVKVQLMLPGKCDVNLLVWAARSFYERFLNEGIEIYERQGVVLHAKTMCIDHCISVIGSANLDTRSIEYNCELSTIIHNREFAGQMNAMFEDDIAHARKISLGEWRHRPMLDRIGQWAVSRARYLL